MTAVDVRLVDGVAAPAEAGVEAVLAAADPVFAVGWAAVTALLPEATLTPLFAGVGSLTTATVTDLLDAARMRGGDPPDLLRWFSVDCPDELLEVIVLALEQVSLVEWVGTRPRSVPAGLLRDGTVSWGTNPMAVTSLHLHRSPHGVDALHAWQVAGGTGLGSTVVDVENAWGLEHDELLAASISPASVFGTVPEHRSHGTSVLGVLVGSDNGVGTVGLVPDASVRLVTADRGGGAVNEAAAIGVAAIAAGVGGVVLLEIGFPISAVGGADLLLECHRPVHDVIRVATLLGVTVVEAAGNGAVDLDTPPALPPGLPRPVDPTLPTRSDSGAVVVGAGALRPDLSAWDRATFSTHGSRVDCFAHGNALRAPSAAGPSAYTLFGGTSGASAVVAGVVAAVQGMALAASGATLAPSDVRNLLRDSALGTPTAQGVVDRIGTMPDLRRVARSQGWARVLPVAAAAVGDDAAVLVHLDDHDRIVRRHFSFFTGWGRPLPPPADDLDLWPAAPLVLSWQEQDPVARLVHTALVSGPLGLHQLWWDSNGQVGPFAAPVVPTVPGSPIAHGSVPAAVRIADDALVIAGIAPQGRMVAMLGDPSVHLGGGVSGPLVLDPVAGFRRTAGPAVAARAGSVDVVAVEDGGTLWWATGTPAATIGTGWSPGVSDPSGTRYLPGARPALLAVDGRLVVAAVGDEGWLRTVDLDPNAGPAPFADPMVVDPGATLAASGPLALVRLTRSVLDVLVVFGIDTDGALRVASRPVAGGDWTPLGVVPSSVPLSPLGGVTATVSPDLGVLVFAVGVDGRIRSTSARSALDWDPLRALPDP